MSLPSKSVSLDEDGRLRVDQSASKVKHAKITVGTSEVELTASLANRRKLYIKPLRSSGGADRPRRWIAIGPTGFGSDGTPVWEEFELVLDIGPDDQVFAKKGDTETGDIDVRIMELGED